MRFLRYILLVSFFAALSLNAPTKCLAQESRTPSTLKSSAEEAFASAAKNTLFVEGLGNGGLYSFNYDRRLAPTWNLRIGVSNYRVETNFFDVLSGASAIVAVPLIGSYLYNFPNSPSFLELGLGITSAFLSVSANTVVPANAATYLPIPTAVAMYRLMPTEGGFSLRAGVTPLLLPGFLLPWIGVSLGWTFGGF
ncbi:MAG: hypothetical protein MUF71_18165 [Candidatus Kapabacteria bacterium]|nr:hypothetical protein [Candidatus Kapabacteria bacterium]